MAGGNGIEGLVERGRDARSAGDPFGAALLFHQARIRAVQQGLRGDEVLSLLIQEAMSATDAGLFDQAMEALDELDSVAGPTAPAWLAAQARLARSAVLDARARVPNPRPK